MGICSSVFLILLTLKLIDVIQISWFWVFSPLFLGAVVWTVIALAIFILSLFAD